MTPDSASRRPSAIVDFDHHSPEHAADPASSGSAGRTDSAADSVPGRAAFRSAGRARPTADLAAAGAAGFATERAAEPTAGVAAHRAAESAAYLPAAPAAPPPTLDQLAFAHLIRSGAFDRHLRTARRAYRRRRDAFVAELGRLLPECPVSSASAGLHVILRVPGVPAAAVAEAAVARGLRVGTMAEHSSEPGLREDRLVLGYGAMADGQVVAAVAELAGVIAAVAG